MGALHCQAAPVWAAKKILPESCYCNPAITAGVLLYVNVYDDRTRHCILRPKLVIQMLCEFFLKTGATSMRWTR